MTIKQSYPKVKLNLLGNLHQNKVIHVIQEDDAPAQSQEVDIHNSAELSPSKNDSEYSLTSGEVDATKTKTKKEKILELVSESGIVERYKGK